MEGSALWKKGQRDRLPLSARRSRALGFLQIDRLTTASGARLFEEAGEQIRFYSITHDTQL